MEFRHIFASCFPSMFQFKNMWKYLKNSNFGCNTRQWKILENLICPTPAPQPQPGWSKSIFLLLNVYKVMWNSFSAGSKSLKNLGLYHCPVWVIEDSFTSYFLLLLFTFPSQKCVMARTYFVPFLVFFFPFHSVKWVGFVRQKKDNRVGSNKFFKKNSLV